MTHVAPKPFEMVELDTSSLEMRSAAEAALVGALVYCAEKMNLGSPQGALDGILSDKMAGGYFRYGLARQIAGYLADLDDQIRAVYLYDYDATPEDVIFGEPEPISPLHLIVILRGGTEGLRAVIAALDEALARHFSGEDKLSTVAPPLAVALIEDAPAGDGSGAGALLKSLHLPPLLVWER